MGGFGKHYNLHFYPSLGHGICEIFRIPCASVACKSMLDQPWISSIQSTKQACYQPVINCTYWLVLGPYNNWNIIHLTPKINTFWGVWWATSGGLWRNKWKYGLISSIMYVWFHWHIWHHNKWILCHSIPLRYIHTKK